MTVVGPTLTINTLILLYVVSAEELFKMSPLVQSVQ